jgi:hypothetical protein
MSSLFNVDSFPSKVVNKDMVTCSQQYTGSGECSITSTDFGSTLILPGSGPSNYSKVRHILILSCAQKDVLNGTSAVVFLMLSLSVAPPDFGASFNSTKA